MGPRDVFPEEFATFLLTDPRIRAAFMERHAHLLDAAWWERVQQSIREGDVPEVLSYPDHVRFRIRDDEAATPEPRKRASRTREV